jgi:hypothetical protein
MLIVSRVTIAKQVLFGQEYDIINPGKGENQYLNNPLFERTPPIMATPAQIAEAMRILGAKNYKISLREEGVQPTTSGTSVGMTGNPQSDYAKRTMTMPAAADPQSYPRSTDDLKDAHDRIAYITQMPCAPDTIEAIRAFGESIIYEVVKTISDENMKHLIKAHDGIAKSCGMHCDSSANPQEHLLKQHELTLKRMQETHNQRMQELQQLIQQKNNKPYYRPGDYLREQMRTMNRAELLDRSRPWPEWMSGEKALERVLGELQVEYLGLYDAIYGLTPEGPTRFLR